MHPSADAPPAYLVLTCSDRADFSDDGPAAALFLRHGGRLLVNLAEPLRVYEYLVRIPPRTVIIEWPSNTALDAFLASEDYARHRAGRLGPWTATRHGPATDWDPAHPAQWIRNGSVAETPAWPADLPPGDPIYRAAPIFHVTMFELAEVEGLQTAEGAMDRLDLYGLWGGFPIINRKPVQVLEGDWGPDRGLLVTQWPCLAAFEDWYLGEPYQQTVKPLRLRSGRYSLMTARAFDGASTRFRRVEVVTT